MGLQKRKRARPERMQRMAAQRGHSGGGGGGYWAPRTRKRHQQEHRLQRPTKRNDPTQHAKGRTGGPVKKQQPNGMSHRGGLQRAG